MLRMYVFEYFRNGKIIELTFKYSIWKTFHFPNSKFGKVIELLCPLTLSMLILYVGLHKIWHKRMFIRTTFPKRPYSIVFSIRRFR